MPVAQTPFFVAMAAAALGSCGTHDSPPGDITSRNTASARVVDVAAGAIAALPRWTLDPPDLIIGAAEGAPEYLLHRAGAPRRLPGGRIVVSNNSTEIRYFDASGKYLMTVGRPGDGPGEFRQLWGAYPLKGDSVLAPDAAGAARVSVFDSAGKLARSFTVSARVQYPQGVTWFRDGSGVYLNYANIAAIMKRPEISVVRDSGVLMRMMPGGGGGDSIVRLPTYWWNGGRGWVGQREFSGDPMFAADPARVVVAHGDEFVVRWYDLRGTLKATSRVLELLQPVTPRDIAHQDSLDSRGRRLGGEGGPQKVYASTLPVISRVSLDAAGRTWVRRWVFSDAAKAEWIVFDTAGAPIARMETPVRLSLSEMTGSDVLGRFTDEDGVQSIRRYRIRF